MEDIKNDQTALQPDIRRTMFVIVNQQTGEQRPFSFKDIELRVTDIPTPRRAPEEVRDMLVTAKNLLLYSWYYYPFTMTASLQAAVALERALKIRLKAKPRDTLSFMLKRAIRERLIVDEGFPRWQAHRHAYTQLHGDAQKAKPRSLKCLLLMIFPRFRNTLAHGDPFLADIGFQQLDIATEEIEQLFPSGTNP